MTVALSATAAVMSMLTLASCDDSRYPAYSEFVDIDPAGWAPGNPAEFLPWPVDSLDSGRPYSISLSLRYMATAPDTCPIAVCIESLDTPPMSDTIPFVLRNQTGGIAGKGNFGVYTLSATLLENTRLHEGLRIAVEPVAPVTGVASVGITLK